jgi:SAM-dependent methyltransferase
MFIANLSWYKKLSKDRSRSFASVLNKLIDNNLTVLDFGCGNMYTSLELLQLNPSLNITGIDVIRDQNLTDEALANPKISFKTTDEAGINFPDNTFDVAIALATMHHTPNPPFFLSELKRVVRPGGHIILIEEMYLNFLDKIYISGQDWLLNKLKEGVPVPLNFKSKTFYLKEFKEQQLEITFEGSVRPFPTMMHHYVFKLKKS